MEQESESSRTRRQVDRTGIAPGQVHSEVIGSVMLLMESNRILHTHAYPGALQLH